MIVKTLVVSVILVAIVMLALGIKMLFDKNAEFTVQSCSFENGDTDIDRAYYKCQLKDTDNCPEIKHK